MCKDEDDLREIIGRMLDKAVAKHEAAGTPTITREEADRRAEAAVADAHAKLADEVAAAVIDQHYKILQRRKH